jgi:hypothetical protein
LRIGRGTAGRRRMGDVGLEVVTAGAGSVRAGGGVTAGAWVVAVGVGRAVVGGAAAGAGWVYC